ncbi:TPA: hypothetical protein N0F65_009952 [Lagenidium giganteum]|uniref:DUF7869 domain-containing protein n=1 Tax=Lagenidium giganteum TaxID=4803 RepID=A0AAV2YY54_9STRA|nr:TPA: hypothetical protein N0F65_009952 [Lagenidium giganteum]
MLSHNMYVTLPSHDRGGYEIMLGRDLLLALGMKFEFDKRVMEWDGIELSMQPSVNLKAEAVEDCIPQHLPDDEQQGLYDLLSAFDDLNQGTIGTMPGEPYDFELHANARPYHARPFSIPQAYVDTVKFREVDRLESLEVIVRDANSPWAAPAFINSKKDKTVRFLTDFRQLNARLVRKPFPMPKIAELLQACSVSNECQRAFDQLEALVAREVALYFPDFSSPFDIHTPFDPFSLYNSFSDDDSDSPVAPPVTPAPRVETGKTEDVEYMLQSLRCQHKCCKETSLLTFLAQSECLTAARPQGRGERKCYKYALPHVGIVCKKAFQTVYDISNNTLTAARAQLARSTPKNSYASYIDRPSLVKWYEAFALKIGTVVPVRFRRQKTMGGIVPRYHTKVDYTLLPAHYTWETLRLLFVAQMQQEDAAYIRAPRANMCDVSTVHHLRSISGGMTTDQAEEQAAVMRDLYGQSCENANETSVVTTIDFALNVALPHWVNTPSSKRTAGKGSNEVVSMINKYARAAGIYDDALDCEKTWEIYADNCSAQNKNNTMIKFLMFLTHAKHLKAAKPVFFVKGQIKNNCDRGFGNIKRNYAKHGPAGKLYKDLRGLKKYQIFEMSADNP